MRGYKDSSILHSWLLPMLFAIGTAIPVILLLVLMAYLGFGGMLLKKSRRIGKAVQLAAGVFLFLLGIYDSAMYWS
ncbi:hypothetical protein [Ectobacillus ponti]|uniref:Uncharacterized protein n=1 Tax=Ectobacillus ponti TaxID=2961894 RepID=A0AA41XB34_9BACI|nr:hypothetical protein [Ectobacillus ponti]MCP8970428.1 hypothetical protein [Ectobacillus ponti]